MIYLVLFFFFSFLSLIELNVEDRAAKINLAAAFSVSTLFLIIMAGTRTIGFDYTNYAYLYEVLNIHNYLENTVEVGYALITELAKRAGLSFNQFLLLIAFFGVGLKMLFLFRWSSNWFLSLTYYFAIGFTVNEMGQIRHGLAIGIVLLAFADLFRENYRGFFFKTFIAFLFHASALIVFPVYFLVRKKNIPPLILLLSLIPFLTLVFIDLKTFIQLIIDYLPLTQVQAKLSYYVLSEEYGNHLGFNLSLCLRLIFLLVVYRYHSLGKSRYYYYDTLWKLYYFGVVLYMVFNSIGDIAIRSSLYFKTLECLIIPMIVSLGKGRLEKNILWVIMILYSFWSLYKIVFDPAFSESYLPYKSILF